MKNTVVKEIASQINTLRSRNFEPRFVSLNVNGYTRLKKEEGLDLFPSVVMDLPIVCNPHQTFKEVIVLTNPEAELAYS